MSSKPSSCQQQAFTVKVCSDTCGLSWQGGHGLCPPAFNFGPALTAFWYSFSSSLSLSGTLVRSSASQASADKGAPALPSGKLGGRQVWQKPRYASVHQGIGIRLKHQAGMCSQGSQLGGRRACTFLVGRSLWPRAAATAVCRQWGSWCPAHQSSFALVQGRLSHCLGSSTPPPVPFLPANVSQLASCSHLMG